MLQKGALFYQKLREQEQNPQEGPVPLVHTSKKGCNLLAHQVPHLLEDLHLTDLLQFLRWAAWG